MRDKKKMKESIVVAILMLIAWLCRFPPFYISTIPYLGGACGLLRPLIYIGLCVAWSVSLSHAIVNKRLRVYMKTMSFCCILWLFLRTVKYELTYRGDSVNIFLQYAYYIPFIALPTLGFFVSLYARRGEHYNMPRALHFSVSLISILAGLFVFTNPLHELFWKHEPKPYSHAIGYYIVVSWLVLLVAMAVMNIVVRARIPGKRNLAKLPVMVLIIIIGYFTTLAFFPKVWQYISSDWTSFTCLATLGLMQSCISAGMLPSNRGYAQLFEAANDGAIITDDDLEICYKSKGAENLPKDILKKATSGIYEMDENTLLKSEKLHPGYVVWREDISDIAAVLKKLEQNRKELTAKNELDRENNKTALALSRAQEKNRLYDLAQTATSAHNKLLHDILAEYFVQTDERFKKTLLAKAAVIGAYIKRKGNLIFVGDKGIITATELKLCLEESLSNIELLHTVCQMDYLLKDEQEMPLNTALYLYDCFETAVEAALPDIEALYVRIIEENDTSLKAIFVLATSHDLSAVEFPEDVQVEKDNDAWHISLSFGKGGNV